MQYFRVSLVQHQILMANVLHIFLVFARWYFFPLFSSFLFFDRITNESYIFLPRLQFLFHSILGFWIGIMCFGLSGFDGEPKEKRKIRRRKTQKIPVKKMTTIKCKTRKVAIFSRSQSHVLSHIWFFGNVKKLKKKKEANSQPNKFRFKNCLAI